MKFFASVVMIKKFVLVFVLGFFLFGSGCGGSDWDQVLWGIEEQLETATTQQPINLAAKAIDDAMAAMNSTPMSDLDKIRPLTEKAAMLNPLLYTPFVGAWKQLDTTGKFLGVYQFLSDGTFLGNTCSKGAFRVYNLVYAVPRSGEAAVRGSSMLTYTLLGKDTLNDWQGVASPRLPDDSKQWPNCP